MTQTIETSKATDLQTASVLVHGCVQTDGTQWTQKFHLTRDAVLNVSAFATGNYNGGTTSNAGITVRLFLDDTLVGADRGFEAQSDTVTFFASTSLSRFVEKGSHTLRVERQDVHLTGEQSLQTSYYALAVRDRS